MRQDSDTNIRANMGKRMMLNEKRKIKKHKIVIREMHYSKCIRAFLHMKHIFIVMYSKREQNYKNYMLYFYE